MHFIRQTPCRLARPIFSRTSPRFALFTTKSPDTDAPTDPPPPPKKLKGNHLPPRPTLPTSDIHHKYLKGSGPGGQKINKTSSAVQLTHLPTGIVVKSQATRSRSQNHNIARRLLAEKIEFLEKGEDSRVAKRVERDQRKKASAGKKKRRKYRKLAEEEDKAEDEEEQEGV